MNFAHRSLCSIAFVAAVEIGTSAADADVVNRPNHPHAGRSVVTWDDPHIPIPDHTHQHRTNHDPFAGTDPEVAGGEAYKTQVYNVGPDGRPVLSKPGSVWVGQELVIEGSNPRRPPGHEALHGHQGHEIDYGRYHVHEAFPTIPEGDGDGITPSEAREWNRSAASITKFVFDAWNVAGTGSGTNWPRWDVTSRIDPTGVPWHSSVDWRQVSSLVHHEVDIVYGEADPIGRSAGLANTGPFPAGTHQNQLTITMDDDVDWFYAISRTPTASQYDFTSVLLHEAGHVVGLGHFGNSNAYVMKPVTAPGQTTRTIDPDAIHGVRDLYAIPGEAPEPSAAVVLAMGGFLATMRRRHSRLTDSTRSTIIR